MCGRFVILDLETIIRKYHIAQKPGFTFSPRYNIAPGQLVPIVIREKLPADIANRLELMKWGLIPFWAKDPAIGNRLINARAETLAEKLSFKSALKSNRCLVPASGFYEWKEIGGRKIPFLIKVKETSLFSFAGLYDIWKDEQENEVKTFTIITTSANSFMAPIHNRMPVILKPENEEVWLNKSVNDIAQLISVLNPYPSESMEGYPVSPAVNNPKNDSEDLVRPISSQNLFK
ncbi:MAG: SOS response-associated peptidase [bacterium]|nr:SOS response-associated peptidase [bacterium]